jgi:hypothetical protein
LAFFGFDFGHNLTVRIGAMRKTIAYMWGYVFDHEISPLRHIPDFTTRHMVLQVLGWMWAIAFAVAIGSYTILAASLVGHAVLIGALAITVATYTTAANRPEFFLTRSGRRRDGEHV